MAETVSFARCVVCGEVDADTEVGWSVCGSCFRIDDPVPPVPTPPWVVAARVATVVLFLVAAAFLFAALNQLT